MSSNVGSIDKVIRYALSMVLVVLSLTIFKIQDGNVIGYGLIALAVIFTVTAFISWCPIWAVFRIKTTKN